MQRSPGDVGTTASPPPRCAFCGYAIPSRVVRDDDGTAFCSERCRDAYEAGDEPFAGRFDFRRYRPEVAALDAVLPWGMPANAFVLLVGHEGIRHRGLQTEVVWRALQRGEPGVMISYVDSPVAIVEHFLAFGWNVLPYLESGELCIVDCFTHRLRPEHRVPDRQVPWNAFLEGFLDNGVFVIEDTTNLRSVENRLHDAVEGLDMVGQGVIVVDSLNEVSTQANELETEQFIKEVRGDICNRLFVPMFASTTVDDEHTWAQDHAYLFDGIVKMRHEEELLQGVRLKQIGVRKLDGTRYWPQWLTYERMGARGFVPFDPFTELAQFYGTAESGVPVGGPAQAGWDASASTTSRPAGHVAQANPGTMETGPDGDAGGDHSATGPGP